MSDRLLMRLASDGSLTWLRGEGDARTAVTIEGAPPAALLAGAGEIIVLVPSEDVLLTEAKLSARSRAQLLQALPYAVEDQLLGAPEDLHFAAARNDGDQLGVAVVAKAKLQAWLDRLGDAGIRPDAMIPETLALPVATGGATVFIEDARAIVRLGAWSAFACSLHELSGWLVQAETAGGAAPLTVHDFRQAPALELPLAVAGYAQRQRDPLAFLAAGATGAPLNLLDGAFAPQHRGARGARWWRVAAMLAAAVLVLAFANLGFDLLRLARASAHMDALARDEVRKAFPDIDAAQLARVGPGQAMRGRLDRLRGGAEASGLLRVLRDIAPVLGSTTRIQTRGMEYRNGTLELSLRAPDVGALDRVRERLATVPGLQPEVTAANPGADGVDGRIRIAGGHGGSR
jgi:general secretion pathway protein L